MESIYIARVQLGTMKLNGENFNKIEIVGANSEKLLKEKLKKFRDKEYKVYRKIKDKYRQIEL